MSKSAISVLFSGVYFLSQGLLLFFVPNFLLTLFGIPEALDYWARVVGLALIIFAYYYIRNAMAGNSVFFGISAQGRILQFILFIVLYLLYSIPIFVVGFSFIEMLTGIWTMVALRGESQLPS